MRVSLICTGHKKYTWNRGDCCLKPFDVFRGKVFLSSEAFYQIIMKDNRVSKGKSSCQACHLIFHSEKNRLDFCNELSLVFWKGLR